MAASRLHATLERANRAYVLIPGKRGNPAVAVGTDGNASGRNIQENLNDTRVKAIFRQKELPRLPVAPLHESLTRYLESLEPLLSQTELDHAREILQQLLRVVDMSPETDVGIGILTTEHRDVWAESYKRLCQDSKNAACVEAIRKAVFVLCLDRPLNNSEPYEVACPQQMFVGGRDGENAANRWCDKSLQTRRLRKADFPDDLLDNSLKRLIFAPSTPTPAPRQGKKKLAVIPYTHNTAHRLKALASRFEVGVAFSCKFKLS
ncbi:hypothetical protein HPB47_013469 [Ixodes persulcatus]|uniref:Uncharacterized protein n=1 Tax=Ixodes persulcatus TaxID=34615 RepID=A0AC60R2B9_IXOPE|nr:hypothetical protein HPB47_013469 [Ixodes persulcatus]